MRVPSGLRTQTCRIFPDPPCLCSTRQAVCAIGSRCNDRSAPSCHWNSGGDAGTGSGIPRPRMPSLSSYPAQDCRIAAHRRTRPSSARRPRFDVSGKLPPSPITALVHDGGNASVSPSRKSSCRISCEISSTASVELICRPHRPQTCEDCLELHMSSSFPKLWRSPPHTRPFAAHRNPDSRFSARFRVPSASTGRASASGFRFPRAEPAGCA